MIRALLRTLRDTARLMVGLPDYEAYLRHMAAHHPDRPAMDRAAFFRDRQRARYGGGGGRCC
ncbi:YbdD/YjiX family protein [Sphingomonas sp.]|uniref:YbdD/YjiX family protein n=1 Tax=Sphingomonas sp. TaxID=28214 RepID=UPI002EDB9183